MTPETPVQGRPSAPTARELAHAFFVERCSAAKTDHCDLCDGLMADIEARDAAAEARERVYREALEDIGWVSGEACSSCEAKLDECECDDGDDYDAKHARRALAAVEALKQGGL